MKLIKTMMIAAGTASVALAPIAATAASSPVRAVPTASVSSDLQDDSDGTRSGTGIILAIGAAALIVLGIVIAADGTDDPVSP